MSAAEQAKREPMNPSAYAAELLATDVNDGIGPDLHHLCRAFLALQTLILAAEDAVAYGEGVGIDYYMDARSNSKAEEWRAALAEARKAAA